MTHPLSEKLREIARKSWKGLCYAEIRARCDQGADLIDRLTTPSADAEATAEAGKCPRCGSPSPELHPAVQYEGEVQPCSHEFHGRTTPSADAVAEANIVAKNIAEDLSAQGRKLDEPLGHELYFRVLEAGAPMIAQAIDDARRGERLRAEDRRIAHALSVEAADEIERLRALKRELTAVWNQAVTELERTEKVIEALLD